MGQFDWAEVAATGTLSLLSVSNDLPAADLTTMRTNARTFADQIITTLGGEGYPSLISGSSAYPWGSNSFITNRMLVLGVVYDATDDLRYLKAMNRSMDYLMGNNAMRLSYVTGYGEFYETDLHDRWAWGRYPGIAYPKGWLSGGPNSELINDPATPTGRPAAKSYAAKNTAPEAWGSKENTINWNAPLAWTATFLTRNTSDLAGPPGDVVPPTVPQNLRSTGTTTTSISLAWNPSTDNVGVVGYDVFRGGVLLASPTGTAFTDTGLTPDTAYTYAVRARDAGGFLSALSTPLTVRTPPGNVQPPPAPQNLRIINPTPTTLTVVWDPVTGAAGYNVYRGSILVGTPTGTTFTDTGLTPSTAYSYSLRTRDAAGNLSAVSTSVTGTTLPGGGGSSCTATYRTTGSWGGGFQGEVTVTNTGTTSIAGWTVVLSIASGRTINNLWNGVLNGSTVVNAGHNGALAPGATTGFGFVANGDVNGAITVISCTTR
jgi:endoglucanase